MTEWARGFLLADFQLHMLCWSTSNIVAIFVAPIRIAIYANTGGLSRSGVSIVQSCSFPRTGWDAKRYQSMGRQDITKRLSSTFFGYSRTGRTSSNARATQVTNSLKQSKSLTASGWHLRYSPCAASFLVVQVATLVALILHRLSHRFVRQTSRVDASHAVTSEAIARATRAGRCSEPNESKHPTIRA